jgi:Rrf2 family nitric oxide-sensitive transcriptional repressor
MDFSVSLSDNILWLILDIKIQLSHFWKIGMISQSAEYSLRAVVCLASRPQQAMTTQQIASVTRIPPGYLSKVLQTLARAGMLESQRGIHGGFVLSRKPENITLLELVKIVDPSHRIQACPLDIAEHQHNLCPLHREIDRAISLAENALGDTTVASLLQHPSGTQPLCTCFGNNPGNVNGNGNEKP